MCSKWVREGPGMVSGALLPVRQNQRCRRGSGSRAHPVTLLLSPARLHLLSQLGFILLEEMKAERQRERGGTAQSSAVLREEGSSSGRSSPAAFARLCSPGSGGSGGFLLTPGWWRGSVRGKITWGARGKAARGTVPSSCGTCGLLTKRGQPPAPASSVLLCL